MAWQIEFTPRAEKDFAKLSPAVRQLIAQYLNQRLLRATDPRDFGKPLRGDKYGIWRYRVGKYRILCSLIDNRLVILVVEIGKRDSIYD